MFDFPPAAAVTARELEATGFDTVLMVKESTVAFSASKMDPRSSEQKVRTSLLLNLSSPVVSTTLATSGSCAEGEPLSDK